MAPFSYVGALPGAILLCSLPGRQVHGTRANGTAPGFLRFVISHIATLTRAELCFSMYAGHKFATGRAMTQWFVRRGVTPLFPMVQTILQSFLYRPILVGRQDVERLRQLRLCSFKHLFVAASAEPPLDFNIVRTVHQEVRGVGTLRAIG